MSGLLPSALLPANLPYPLAWAIAAAGLLLLSTIWPRAALMFALLVLLSALLLHLPSSRIKGVM